MGHTSISSPERAVISTTWRGLEYATRTKAGGGRRWVARYRRSVAVWTSFLRCLRMLRHDPDNGCRLRVYDAFVMGRSAVGRTWLRWSVAGVYCAVGLGMLSKRLEWDGFTFVLAAEAGVDRDHRKMSVRALPPKAT